MRHNPWRSLSKRTAVIVGSVALLVLVFAVLRGLAPRRPEAAPFVATELADNVGRLPEGLFDYPVLEIRDSVLTSMAAMPDGDLMLGLRDGRLYRFHPRMEQLPERAFYELPTIQTAEGGIIGLAVSPDFPSGGYLYVDYTELADDGAEYLTVCRLKVDPDDPQRALPGSYEVVHRIRDDLPSEIHYGGGMAFGTDGYLYVGVGDDAEASNAQNPESLRGKLLRLLPDGGIPEDNPIWPGSSGPTAVYAIGLRNPFRLVVDPFTHDIYIHDVGNTLWEEANRLGPGGSNYGWPILEGPLEVNPGIQPPLNYVDPFFSYRHRSDGTSSAIVGGLVYQGDKLPAPYRHAYLVGDYDQVTGSLLRLVLDKEPQLRVVQADRFYETPGAIVDMVELDGAVYYSTIWTDFRRPVPWTSAVRRIDVLRNPLPRITLPTAVFTKAVPAQIESEAQIAYPRPEELELEWRLGGELVGTGAHLSTVVDTRGFYSLTLRATEPFGAYAEETLQVRAFGRDPFSLSLLVDDMTRAGSAVSPNVQLNLIDPLTGAAASTVDAAGELEPFAPVDGKDGRIEVPPTTLALFGEQLRLRLESPGLVALEREFPVSASGDDLPSKLHLSEHALQVRAVTPNREPLAGLKLLFSLENGPPLPQTGALPVTDLSGHLYLPLTESQAVSTLLAIPSGDNPSIYEDVEYRRVPPHADDWTLVFSPRGRARLCDSLEPSLSPASYDEVQSVFSVFCIGCHNNNKPASDLSLLEGFSFSQLYQRDSLEMPGRKLLDVRAPSDSYLLEKIECLLPTHGYLMPPSSRGLLTPDHRQIITNWIHQGMVTSAALDLRLFISQEQGLSPLRVQLRAGARGGAPPYTVRWDLGDGAASDVWSLEHSYSADSSGTVFRGTVTVRDADGLETSSPFEVRVSVPGDGER